MSSQYPILDNRPIDQWKVTELKEELRRRKLTTRGLKEELVKRLDFSIREERELLQHEPDNGLNENSDAHEMQALENPEPDGGAQITEDGNLDADSKNLVSSGALFKSDKEGIKSVVDTEEETQTHVEVTADITDLDPVVDVSIDEGSEIHAEVTTVTTDLDPTVDVTTNMNAPLNEAVCPEVTSEKSFTNAGEGTQTHIEDTVGTTDLNVIVGESAYPVISMESAAPESITAPILTETPCQHPIQDEKNDEKDEEPMPLTEDDVRVPPESNDQVSEVKPDLGIQVKSDSISTDNESFNQKNELKDNLNADNFHLELGVVNPEVGHPSSKDVIPTGGDLLPLDNVQEPDGNEMIEELDDVANATDVDLAKKNNIADGLYSEKLNLDRSSGDESMEEDVLESKQIESNTNIRELEDNIEVIDSQLKEVSQLGTAAGGASSPQKGLPAEEDNKSSIPAEKRKLEGQESLGGSEPTKRQRRWNTETIKVPEKLPNLISSGTPKGFSQSTPRRTFTRSDSTLSGDTPKERIVPSSQSSPTNSLKIDRFVRPFTLKAVQELLGKTGTVCSFWMDNIKTHCYVTYSSEEEAAATRNAVYNLQWPPNGGRLLIAEFVDPQEVKMRVEAPAESSGPISPTPTTPLAPSVQPQPTNNPPRHHGLKKELPPPPSVLPPPPPLADPSSAKERLPPPPPPLKKAEPPILTLDDLFLKTKATPRIYYLPLSEEEVAAKRAKLSNRG